MFKQIKIHFLINERNYSKNLIKLETGLRYGNRRKRTDIQVFNNNGELNTIIECKAPEINLNQKVINQILQYHKVLAAKILVISNGLEHVIISVLDGGKIEYLQDFPSNL